MTSPPARVRGPVAVAVFLALAAVAVTSAWLVLGERPRPTDVVDLSAIDGEYAVLIRDVRGDPARSFLSLFHIDRGEVWGALIPRYEQPGGPRTGVATTIGTVTVRASAQEGIGITAFAAAEGEKMGRLTLAGPDGTPAAASDLPGIGTVFGGGESFEILGEPGRWASVTAVDVAAGEPRWRLDLGDAPVGPVWLRERHLLLYQPGRLRIVDRLTGADVKAAGTGPGIALAPWPCATADRVYGFRGEALHAIDLAPHGVSHGAALADGALPADIPAGRARLTGACGTYRAGGRDRDVLAMNLEGEGGVVVAVERDTRAPAWILALDAPLVAQEALRLATPDAVPLTGRLPRFVPVLVGRPGAVTLVMLDMEAGRIAWQGVPGPGLAGARLMRHATEQGTRHYLWLPESAHLAVLDGNTGALTAAVSLNEYAPIWPRNLAGDRVWIHDARRWAVLDAATLAVVPGEGLPAPRPAISPKTRAAAREALTRALGLPAAPPPAR